MSRLCTALTTTTLTTTLTLIVTVTAVAYDGLPLSAAGAVAGAAATSSLATVIVASRDHLANLIIESEARTRRQMTNQLEHVLELFGRYAHDEEQTAGHLATIRADEGAATVTRLRRG